MRCPLAFARWSFSMSSASYRLPINLSEDEILFLERIGLQAKRTGGFRLPKAAVVRALIEVAMRLEIDVTGVRTEEELKERILSARMTDMGKKWNR